MSALNNALVIVGVILSIALLFTTWKIIEGHKNLEEATERYIECHTSAERFEDASDYLTNECRYFVVTGDVGHAQNFINEVVADRRRENALEEIERYLTDTDSSRYLREGMEVSGQLADRECYAMRLAADVWEVESSALPEAVAAIEPTAEDAALTADQKKEAAMEMVFGTAYQEDKARIHQCVEESVNALINGMRLQQIDFSKRVSRLLLIQRALIVMLVAVMFAIVGCTYLLVIRPLRRSVIQIRGHQEIPVEGSSEMCFLAQTYNDMFAQHARSTEELTYSATHDSLTGLYNRTAYDAECLRVDPSQVGVLIIDVDKFKEYNDTYGHDVGDRVLQRVAKVLTDSFRSEDFISRIGGDEFCVIMKNVSSQMHDLVAFKIQRANNRLQNPEDDLPKVTISVGVAFGDRKNPTDSIFKDADTALYHVKRKGRANCAFY